MFEPAALKPFIEFEDDRAIAADLPRLEVLMAAPRGFCAGVRRAIDAVRDAIDRHGAPVYVRRPIVHNLAVVRELEAYGAVFVEELDQVPPGGVVVLSAHGVAPSVREEAATRGLVAYDAVCPLVAKVHREVERHHRNGRHVILVGHEGHPEIVGTLGHIPAGAASLVRTAQDVASLQQPRETPIGVCVQTTYALDEAEAVLAALRARFSDVATAPGSDICYATTNRQAALRLVAAEADAIIVVGERFSSNACRLAEVAAGAGCTSVQLIAEADELDWSLVPPNGVIGITAAASTPERSVSSVLDALGRRYRLSIREVGAIEENIAFKRLAVG